MATLRQRHQLRASRIQSNRILDLDWLFEQPGKFTAKPTCLATLGLSQDDVPMLLNLYEDQDAALPQAHLLQLLRHFKLSEEDLLRILARCTEVQSWAVFALLDLTMAHAKVAFTPAAAIVADEDEKPEVACEVMRLIAYMGNADDEVWEDAHSLLVAGLANCSDEARATAHVLALKRLYQVDDLEEDELAPEKQRPVREEAVVAVQEAYRRHLVDVEEAGGFTRFLEVCNWAINPDDAVVKDFRANISAELVEDEVKPGCGEFKLLVIVLESKTGTNRSCAGSAECASGLH
eukprot:TRINITY_DN8161_c0_g1_i2.p1 TRINITY_DN8161_c0_g1~~TRINITY_DN8161_c0_g1_i2.p1  ORF type:complete len:292 (+),score=62.01 TRINITY_DN8161_c0_g1_i2:133-1008(+)